MMSQEWKEVSAQWQGEMGFIGKNMIGASVQMGTNNQHAGISPMELLLLGVAGCTGIDIVHILKKKRIELDQFEVRVRGKRVDDHPKIYDQIEVEYLFWSNELSTKAVEQAIQLSEEKYCSASAMMSKSAQISSSYKIMNPGESAY
jgi:putative redox protein